MNEPLVSIWITSTGRIDCTKRTIDAFIENNTYPNIEFLIFHSIPTMESLKTYYASGIGDPAVYKMFDKLLRTYPGTLWAEPWQPFGNALNLLLANSADYFINLGDANMAVCDGADQIRDGIELMEEEKSLLSLRLDLADESVYAGSDRFDGTVSVRPRDVDMHPLFDAQYLYWKLFPVSAQLVHTERMRDIGFPQDHDLHVKNYVEVYPQERLQNSPLVCGIDLRHKGFLHHINPMSTTNEDRQWRVDAYEASRKKGFYGKQG